MHVCTKLIAAKAAINLQVMHKSFAMTRSLANVLPIHLEFVKSYTLRDALMLPIHKIDLG